MTTLQSTTHTALVCMLVTWVGCSRGAESSELPPAASQGGEATPAEPSGLEEQSDEQILATLTAMDQTEIAHGQLALERSESPQVREFAESMVQKHSASRDVIARIATESGLIAEAGPISRELSVKAIHDLQTLSAADAAIFDEVFVKLQIDQHREFLSVLTGRLLPDADNETLLHQLQATRDSLEEHLMRAEKLAAQLPRTSARPVSMQ